MIPHGMRRSPRFNIDRINSDRTPKKPVAELRWEGRGGREGWWLFLPNGEVWMIHGPSICVTSGGGPARALEKARDMGWTDSIRTIVPTHEQLHGGVCTECVA